MRAVYWKAKAIGSDDRFSIRERTEERANEKRDWAGAESFETVKKITITYSSALDLIRDLLGNHIEA